MNNEQKNLKARAPGKTPMKTPSAKQGKKQIKGQTLLKKKTEKSQHLDSGDAQGEGDRGGGFPENPWQKRRS